MAGSIKMEGLVTDDDLAINLSGVSKTYRRRIRALRDVSLQVRKGEIFGLLGPNGAGKSTLVKIMMTVVRPTTAEGTILGQPVGDKPVLARVGYLPENHRFPRYLTGRQSIEFFAGLSGVDRARRRRRAGELLDIVGMSDWGDTKVSQYSKGMMQRVGLATALAADPDLILLDEPTDGVDPVGRRDVRDVLMKLRAEGKTVLINSHLLSELELVCDRIAVLVKGQVAIQGTMAELTSRRQFYLFEMLSGPETDARFSAALPGVFELSAPAALRRGKLAGGQWCELEGAILRVGIADPLEAQDVLDALRRAGLVIKRMQVVRPTLEDVFIEAVGLEQGKP
jgi:ABC-2 type transport system ATP-binding protein